MIHRTEMEIERAKRIRASTAAYAYEFMNTPLMLDEEFDALCRQINPAISTNKPVIDEFFRTEFSPNTGMWIYKHPELEGIKRIYNSLVLPKQISIIAHERFLPKPGKQLMNSPDITGCNSQFMNMLYIASLGFSVVPSFMNGVKCDFLKEGAQFTESCGKKTFFKYGEIFVYTKLP